jgi:hypothetical protein
MKTYRINSIDTACNQSATVKIQAAFDYLIGDYFLEIRRRLRETQSMSQAASRMSQVLDNRRLNEKAGVTEVTNIPDCTLKAEVIIGID